MQPAAGWPPAPRAPGQKERPTLKVVLSGYYGLGNLGDEAVLAGVLRGLRSAAPGVEAVVLSGDPERTSRLHGVPAAARTFAGAWEALGGAQALVSGGGSLLQDVTSFRSPLYYLAVMALARARGARVVWYAQGIGPVHRAWLRRLAAGEARRAAAITVRDAASRRTLRDWGVDPDRVRVVADPAWLLAATSGPEASGARSAPRPEGERRHAAGAPLRLLAVWRPWTAQPVSSRDAGRALGRAAAQVLPPGSSVTVMAFHPRQDLAACRELVAGAVGADPGRLVEWRPPEAAPEDPAEALRVMAAFDLVVGVRLHALILAAAAGVPFLGVAYDPKVRALVDELAWPVAALDPEEVGESGAWAARLKAVLDAGEHLRASLAEARLRMRERAEAGVQALVAALAGAARPEGAPAWREHAGEPPEPYEILGLPVHPVGPEEAAALVVRWARESGEPPRLRHVVTLNPEMVMRARREPGLADAVRRADLVVPDGIGVVWAARILGLPARRRVPGIELAERCLRELTRLGLPVFLVGGAPPGEAAGGVAQEAARRLQARRDFAGLRIAGTHHGYFTFGSGEEERLLCAIDAARPTLLLVGMGAGRQEAWIALRRERLGRTVRVAIGVGGSLDVWAGRTRRAPELMRRLGLEWLFRAASQPRRFKRLMALPAFAGAVLGCRLGGIMGQRVRKKG